MLFKEGKDAKINWVSHNHHVSVEKRMAKFIQRGLPVNFH